MWNTSLPTCPGLSQYRKLSTTFFTTACIYDSKIATHSTDIISSVCVAFFWVVIASRNEKSCLQFLCTDRGISHALNRVFLHCTISAKLPPADRFDMHAMNRRSPVQVLTQREAARLRWSPGTGHLPHTEYCRSPQKNNLIFIDFLKYLTTLI